MLDKLVLFAFAPVLLVQGAYVRRVTPRLPEPEGAREGLLGQGPPLRLLVLGDSAAAGVGATAQSDALSGQLAARLGARHEVSWKLLAKSGSTTAEVLALLEAAPAEPFDVAVISLGVNDVTGHVPLRRWLATVDRLLDLLRGRFFVRHLLVTRLPPMHRFPALPQPLRAYLGARALRFSARLRERVAGCEDCVFLEPPFPFSAEFIASDGFHPGPRSYAIWAEAAAESVGARMAAS